CSVSKQNPERSISWGLGGVPGPHNHHGNQNYIDVSKAAPSAAWDNVWGENISA
ncbi:hypothetical protein J1N35_001105, partial [Gossypium stocksii]